MLNDEALAWRRSKELELSVKLAGSLALAADMRGRRLHQPSSEPIAKRIPEAA